MQVAMLPKNDIFSLKNFNSYKVISKFIDEK